MNTMNEPKQSNFRPGDVLYRYEPLVPALLTMTLVTGLVDAVSFLGLSRHVFTANMTGNVAFLGFAMAGAPRLSIAASLTSLLAFLFGAVVGGRLGVALSTATRRRQFLTAAAAEAALLFTAALASRGLNLASEAAVSRVYAVIVSTAVAMGLRTVTVRRFSVADITTTVLTSTLAALAADSSLAGVRRGGDRRGTPAFRAGNAADIRGHSGACSGLRLCGRAFLRGRCGDRLAGNRMREGFRVIWFVVCFGFCLSAIQLSRQPLKAPHILLHLNARKRP